MASESRHVAHPMAAPSTVGMTASLADLPLQQHQQQYHHDLEHEGCRSRHRPQDEHNITIPSSSKHAEQTVAPFLAEHIPMQYNPVGSAPRSRPLSMDKADKTSKLTNSKFCYRHRPDLKCRRQANEPSMEQLQNELASLSHTDQQAISHVWSLFSASPAKHRSLMLQGILTQCCFPQLSFISTNVQDLIKIDFLSALPAELSLKILCYLDTTSLCKAAQVSHKWRELADDDVVWHKMCEQHIDRKCTKCGWGLPLLERKRLEKEKREIQRRATTQAVNGPKAISTSGGPLLPERDVRVSATEGGSEALSTNISPINEEPGNEASTSRPPGDHDSELELVSSKKRRLGSGSHSPEVLKRQCTQRSTGEEAPADGYFPAWKRPWKDVYRDRFKVGRAWKHGRCSTKVFKGHSNGVMCLQFDDTYLITGSYDSTAKVWDIKTGQEIRTLTGHASGIRCLQFDDNKLMTGSLDGTMRLWNWRTGQCLRVFAAHSEGIITLHFSGRYVASGSMDHTVRVWDSESKQTFLLRGHKDWINCVRVDEQSRTLFTASDDLTVRLWDLDTKECIRVFEGHTGQVQQVLPMPAEFELDDISYAAENDDDASSVSSSNGRAPLQESSGSARNAPTLPFWADDPERPAPPRYMFTGALDSTIRLWDVLSPPAAQASAATQSAPSVVLPTDPFTNSHVPRAQACIRTFFGHVEGIWALAADHLRLISGSQDRMLKIWDPRSGKCQRSISGHAGPVTCAWLSESTVATGSEDCEVRMLVFGDS